MELDIRIDRMEALMTKIETVGQGKVLRKFMSRTYLFAESRIKETVKKDARTLARSFTSNMDGSAIPLWARVGTPLLYGLVLNDGRRPGAKMPPKGALIDGGWMRRRGIPEGLEFVIRRAIGRRGIAGDHYFTNAVKDTEKKMDEFADDAANELDGMWGQ